MSLEQAHDYLDARQYIGGRVDHAGTLKPTVQVPERVAVFLYRYGGLKQLRDRHIADPELHSVLTAFGIVTQSSSDHGTRQADSPEPGTDSKQLTTAQAAAKAKVSTRAIVKAINEKRLPATKTGTSWTVAQEDLKTYLATKTRN